MNPVALLLLSSVAANTAEGGAAGDQIVITAQPHDSRVLPPVSTIGEAQLIQRQPNSVADAVDALPGVAVRTNSRGEAIARVRGSEERQTQVFLDGAPLAVPWDGRADLGVLPAGLIGSVRATKGPVPIEFGTNTVAGAIDLRTRSGGEASLRAAARIGPLGFADGAGVATLPLAGIGVTLAAAVMTRNAEPVADIEALPFSQPDSDARLNTDLDSVSLFGAAEGEIGRVALRGSLLHLRATRGIAPESDRDPAMNAPRYWRYPEVEQTQLNIGSSLRISDQSSLRLIGWRQWFAQTIVEYVDQTYSAVRAREENEDDTLGGRAVLSADLGTVSLRLVATAQTSRHAQQDHAAPFDGAAPTLIYRQNLFSVGGEADLPLAAGRATVGLAYDHSANPLTGDKPTHPDRGALAFSAAYSLPLRRHWSVTASGGRRNRFPSARELFGEALGRFLPNPDLRPERAWLGDVEIRYEPPRLAMQLIPFVSRVDDTIGQRVVRVGDRNLRQRYNLSGSLSYGIDAALAAHITDALTVELLGTWLRARADEGSAAFRRLPQRPSHELEAALSYAPVDSLSLRGEFRRVGPAVDLGPGGEAERLAPGNEINLRGRWRIAHLAPDSGLWLTGSVDNLSDDVITPQLGLPRPGRSVRVGLQIG